MAVRVIGSEVMEPDVGEKEAMDGKKAPLLVGTSQPPIRVHPVTPPTLSSLYMEIG